MNSVIFLDAIDNRGIPLHIKPTGEILKIFSSLAADYELKIAKKSQVILSLNEKKHTCYFLIKGRLALQRRGDGIVITTETAPFIFGLSNQLGTNNGMYLRVLEDATYMEIPSKDVRKIISKNNLWESLAELLIYTSTKVYEHCARVQQLSSYDIIRSQLIELMDESAEFRNKIAASTYIKDRTYLARSGIMRILAELRNGGYIKMEKGVLKQIIYLPKNY